MANIRRPDFAAPLGEGPAIARLRPAAALWLSPHHAPPRSLIPQSTEFATGRAQTGGAPQAFHPVIGQASFALPGASGQTVA